MKAYLIDPTANGEKITEVEWNGKFDGPQGAYELLGGIRTIEVVRSVTPEGDDLFIDEDAYLTKPTGGFLVRTFMQPIKGKGLVVGEPGDDGESAPVRGDLEWLRDNTVTIERVADGLTAITVRPAAIPRRRQRPALRGRADPLGEDQAAQSDDANCRASRHVRPAQAGYGSTCV